MVFGAKERRRKKKRKISFFTEEKKKEGKGGKYLDKEIFALQKRRTTEKARRKIFRRGKCHDGGHTDRHTHRHCEDKAKILNSKFAINREHQIDCHKVTKIEGDQKSQVTVDG